MAIAAQHLTALFKVDTIKEARALVRTLEATGATVTVRPYGTWAVGAEEDLLFAADYLDVDLGQRGDRAAFSHPSTGESWRVRLVAENPELYNGYFEVSAGLR